MPQPAVEALFEEDPRCTEAGEPVDFDALCARHAEVAAELRSLRDGYQLLCAALPGARAGDAAARAEPPSALWRRLRDTGPHGEHYQQRKEIGRGGMGIVFSVWDPDLKRRMAMKVMRAAPDAAGDSGGLSRFLEEAQITSQLDHPGVVPVHELGVQPDGRAYYTMRQVRGITLSEVFQCARAERDGWNLMRAVEVLLKVCDAMSFAHSKGVLHRDIKPANVMVGRFGEVYVMDFGLARVVGQAAQHDVCVQPEASASAIRTERNVGDSDSPLHTRDGIALGTASYMAPEQAKGQQERLGPHTDVYSVGAMLYHLLSGEMPYVPADAHTVQRVIDGPPKPLAAFGRTAPAALVAICEKSMARVIEERYQRMRDLAADLRAFVEMRVVGAYQTGAWAETRQWVQRNRGLAAALVVAVLAMVAVAGVVVASAAWELERRRTEVILKLADLDSLNQFGNNADAVAHGTPGWPAYEEWLKRARLLLDELPEFNRRLEALRRTAPVDPASRRAAEAVYARVEELSFKRAELLWRDRILRDRQWPTDAETDADLARYQRPKILGDWNAEIFRMVRDDELRVYGREKFALCLAKKLVASVEGTTEWHPRFRDTLAFAYIRVGDFDQAVVEQKLALEDPKLVDPNLRIDLSRNLRRMIRWREDRDNGRERLMRNTLAAEIEVMDQEIFCQAAAAQGNKDAVWIEALARLVNGLLALERRLTAAEQAALDPRWPHAIDAIQRHPRYGGIRINPQLDLLPLGPDPASRLWEFAHLPSGEPARRGPDGKLVRRPDAGLVFVLVPGGMLTHPMYSDQETGAEYRVAPFFVAKYELTRFQRDRLDGRWLGARWLSHKWMLRSASDLGAQDAGIVVQRAGGWLGLPTQVQWHYSAQGGDGKWWMKRSKDELLAAANLRPEVSLETTELEAPGTLVANGFGLHDVIGGVNEWCEARVVHGSEAPQPPVQWVRLGFANSTSYDEFRTNQDMTPLGPNVFHSTIDTGLRPVRALCR